MNRFLEILIALFVAIVFWLFCRFVGPGIAYGQAYGQATEIPPTRSPVGDLQPRSIPWRPMDLPFSQEKGGPQ